MSNTREVTEVGVRLEGWLVTNPIVEFLYLSLYLSHYLHLAHFLLISLNEWVLVSCTKIRLFCLINDSPIPKY